MSTPSSQIPQVAGSERGRGPLPVAGSERGRGPLHSPLHGPLHGPLATFTIGHTEYTIEAPWFFTDPKVFQANRFRRLTDAECLLDPMPFERADFETDLAIAITEYCTNMISLCVDCLNQSSMGDFPPRVLKLHSAAMLNWLCERYYDTYQVKRHVFSLAGEVGWCYLWLRFMDRVFQPEDRCTPVATSTISWEHVDLWDLVFQPYMFTDEVLLPDTYNPVCWERVLQRQRWAHLIRKEEKEAAAQKERESEKESQGGGKMFENASGFGANGGTGNGLGLDSGMGMMPMQMTDEQIRQNLYERTTVNPETEQLLRDETRHLQENLPAMRKATLLFRPTQAESAASRFLQDKRNGVSLLAQRNLAEQKQQEQKEQQDAEMRRIMATVAEEDAHGVPMPAAAFTASSSLSAASSAAGATIASSTTASIAAATVQLEADDPLPTRAPGQTYRQYCETYVVPRKDLAFTHQGQFQGSPREIRHLKRIFDILVLKIQFGSVHPLPDLESVADWRTLLNAFECVSCILFIQFQHLEHAAIETYVRMLAWIESQAQILETFEIHELEFRPATYDALQAHLDDFMDGEAEPDNQLLSAINLSVYLHRMPSTAFSFFQKNPFQTTARNPVSILNEELPEYMLRYMNDYLLAAKPRDIYLNKSHPFHRFFLWMLFACNLKWQKNHYDYAAEYSVTNFHLLQKMADLHRSLDNDEMEKRPIMTTLLGREHIISHWHKNLPSDKEMIHAPRLYRTPTVQNKILSVGFLLLYHFDGQLEDGYCVGLYWRDFYKFEEVYSQLSNTASILGEDPDDVEPEGAEPQPEDEGPTDERARLRARLALPPIRPRHHHRVLGLDEDESALDYVDADAEHDEDITDGYDDDTFADRQPESVMQAFRQLTVDPRQLAYNPNLVFGNVHDDERTGNDMEAGEEDDDEEEKKSGGYPTETEGDDFVVIGNPRPRRLRDIDARDVDHDEENENEADRNQRELDDFTLEENGLYS